MSCCEECIQLRDDLGGAEAFRAHTLRLVRRGWAGSYSDAELAWLRVHSPGWWVQAAVASERAFRASVYGVNY